MMIDPSINTYLITLLAFILIVASITDLRFHKIPNALTYPTMAVALMCHITTNGLNGLFFSSAGLALGIIIFIFPFLIGGMGAGDVKLLGAVGAVLGPRGVFNASVFTAIIGGIYALILLLFRYRKYQSFTTRTATTIKTFVVTGQFIRIPAIENEKKPKLYYGIAISSGTLYTIWWQLSNHSLPL